MCLLASSDRTSALFGWAGKDVQASYCNAVKDVNKIFSHSEARGFQQANTSWQGFFKSLAHCWQMCKQTAHISAHNPTATPTSSTSSSSGLEADKLPKTMFLPHFLS